jgi:hypothetical protein
MDRCNARGESTETAAHSDTRQFPELLLDREVARYVSRPVEGSSALIFSPASPMNSATG